MPPGEDDVHKCGDDADEQSVQDEVRLDAPHHPHREDEGHNSRRDKYRHQKGPLTKEVEHWEDNCEDSQLRKNASYDHADPMQLLRLPTKQSLSDATMAQIVLNGAA
jgi:hypothetical protein